MPPVRRGSKGRAPVALALMAGVLVGLVVAAAQFRRSDGSAGGAVATLSAATGSGAASADLTRLQADLAQARSERDAAVAEAGRLRDEAAKAAKQQATPGSCPDRHTPWGPSAERDKTYPELAEFLKKVESLVGCWGRALPVAGAIAEGSRVLAAALHSCVAKARVAALAQRGCMRAFIHPPLVRLQVAINNEVLVSVSNANYAWPGGMLQLWAENARKAGGQGQRAARSPWRHAVW